MVLVTTVPLSLSSNKLDNNFNYHKFTDANVVLFFFFKKKVLSSNWLATNNNLRCRQELISGALFEQKRFSFDNLTHVVFLTTSELVCKNPLKTSVLKSQFQNPRNLDKKNWIIHAKTTSNSRRNRKYIKYVFSPTARGYH